MARSLLTSSLLVCLLAALALAAPLKLHRKPHTFTYNGKSAAENKQALLTGGRKAAGKNIPMNGGLLTMGAFFLNISVGTDGQIFDVIVDTGSSNTAIPSVGCTTCATSYLYNASASTKSKPLSCSSAMCQNCAPIKVGTDTVPAHSAGAPCPYGPAPCSANGQCGFGFAYGGGGTGTVGTTVTDKMCFTNTEICTDSAYLFQLEQEFPTGTQSTGILGLAYPAIACNPTCQPPILDALAAAGTLPNGNKNFFGMCLTGTEGGMMDLGALEPTRYAPDSMLYTKVVAKTFFSIEIKDIKVGGVSLGVPPMFYKVHNDVLGSFVDSGTTVVLISPLAFQTLAGIMTSNYSSLPGVTDLYGPETCTNFQSTKSLHLYPSISFTVAGINGANGDFDLTIEGKDYLLPSGGDMYCLGIAGIPSIGVILGDVMMQNYYISFDRTNDVVGFAPLLHGSCK